MEATAKKPKRWDIPFDPEMSDESVARLLTLPPFCDMDRTKFRGNMSLEGILKNDTRLHRYRRGELIVRQGDYGTSAYLILSGEVRVVQRPPLPPEVLGRRKVKKKGLVATLLQALSPLREPESLKAYRARQDSRVDVGEEGKVFLQDVPRVLQQHQTETMKPGELFGEIAALSRTPRGATVFADSEEVECLEIRWQGLRDIKKQNTTFDQYIDNRYRQYALQSYLRSFPLFKYVSDETLAAIMAETQLLTFGKYEWSGEFKRSTEKGFASLMASESVIAQEGDYPNGLILVRAGFARLSRRYGAGEKTLSYLGAGSIYGWDEIAHNWRSSSGTVPLQFTLRAMGYTHVLLIPTAVVEEKVLPTIPKERLPAPVVAATERSYKSRKNSGNGFAAEKIGAELVEFLSENRFFNGTATMLIDLDHCTRCDDCVRACESTHDNSARFLRHGPSLGKLMVANACMHCADPVCMIGCPTGAIHRLELGGRVAINPTTCIGCQICFHQCPYEAIRMVEVRNRNGSLVLDNNNVPILKATKCDLCVEQLAGPACQRACPHGALVRMEMSDLDALADWLHR